jgi:hypothetical protein
MGATYVAAWKFIITLRASCGTTTLESKRITAVVVVAVVVVEGTLSFIPPLRSQCEQPTQRISNKPIAKLGSLQRVGDWPQMPE